jgi:hypothetical protein
MLKHPVSIPCGESLTPIDSIEIAVFRDPNGNYFAQSNRTGRIRWSRTYSTPIEAMFDAFNRQIIGDVIDTPPVIP